jgi:glycosyltransferase involved in cell wall biosynthesis
MHHRVHICLPTYCAERTLALTIDSILSQSLSSWKLTIVDNCSTDTTISIAQRYADADSRIQIIANTTNLGAEGNFTKCLSLLDGEYGGIFHSDDIYHENFLDQALSVLDAHPKLGAVFTEAHDIDMAGQIIGSHRLPEILRREGHLRFFNFRLFARLVAQYGNLLVCPSMIGRSAILRDRISRWDGTNFKTSADLDVWFRILQLCPIGVICKPLMSYRVGDASLSFRMARNRTSRHDLFLALDKWIDPRKFPCLDDRHVQFIRLLDEKDRLQRCIVAIFSGSPLVSCRLWASVVTSPLHFVALRHRWHRKFRIAMILVGLALPLAPIIKIFKTIRTHPPGDLAIV